MKYSKESRKMQWTKEEIYYMIKKEKDKRNENINN